MRILTVLGQRIGYTGSGTLVSEFIRNGEKLGDQHCLVNLEYRDGDNKSNLGKRSIIFSSLDGERADIDFPIPGMSDSMPYKSMRYADMTENQVNSFLHIFKSKIDYQIRSFCPDILHIHHLWLLVSLAGYYHLPVFVTVHGSDIKLIETAGHLRNHVLKGIDSVAHFICVSSVFANAASKHYEIPKRKISVIWNGFNSRIFHIGEERENLNQVPIILYAGKFVSWKGLKYLIRACSQIKSPYRLIIAGQGDQSTKNSLLHEVASLGMEGQTAFVGQLNQMSLASVMRDATVFVLPSIDEPFGLVVLEALACGCPVVASNSGGPADFIPNRLIKGDFVELIPPLQDKTEESERKYVDSLSAAICKKLKQDINIRQKEFMHKSIEHLTWENYYLQVKKIFTNSANRNAQQKNQPDW